MDIHAQLDLIAERAKRRHLALLQGFRGVVEQTMAADKLSTRRAFKHLDRDLSELIATHIDGEDLAAADALDTILGASVEQAEVDMGENPAGDVLGALERAGDWLLDQLRRETALQYGRDSLGVKTSLKRIALRADMVRRARRLSESEALIALRASGDIDFNFRDRLGRKYLSETFIFNTWRQTFLFAWNEGYMHTLSDLGEELAQVTTADPSHVHNGIVFAIAAPVEGYPLYDAIRDEVFHPRSRAVVAPNHK